MTGEERRVDTPEDTTAVFSIGESVEAGNIQRGGDVAFSDQREGCLPVICGGNVKYGRHRWRPFFPATGNISV